MGQRQLEVTDSILAFKKAYERWLKLREDINLWHRVAEQSYTTFAAANPPPAKKK